MTAALIGVVAGAVAVAIEHVLNRLKEGRACDGDSG
jgi:hypothetical protein